MALGLAAGVILALVAALVFVLVGDSGDDTPVAKDTATPSATTSPSESATPTPKPSRTRKPRKVTGPGDVREEPAGLFCRDLEAKGYSYVAAVDYWRSHGQPNQMDADRNGIPCETVFPVSDVEAYWGPQNYVPDTYRGIETLPSGLFCRDLAARGYSYPQAVDYWWYWGSPGPDGRGPQRDPVRDGLPLLRGQRVLVLVTRAHRAGIFLAAALAGGAITAAGLLLAGIGGDDPPAASRQPTLGVASPPSTTRTPRPTRTPTTPAPPPRQTPGPTPTPTPTPTPSETRTTYVFPIAGCRVDYSSQHHHYPATDLFAARGCPFVSPVAGVVDEVGRTDRWVAATNRGADRGGRFVSVVGDDGVRYYGSHLESVDPGIAPGARVAAGRRLGAIGDSGSAAGTGPHLHFGISWPSGPDVWWVRRGTVPPAPFLDAWRVGREGSAASPAAAVAAAEQAAGDWSRCRSYC